MNKVILIGWVGNDIEIKYTDDGLAVSSFPVATKEIGPKNKDGKREKKTEWHNLSAFGVIAEHIGKYLEKGDQIAIEGRLRTNKYEDKEGIKRYRTEIIVNFIEFLGKKNNKGEKDEQKTEQKNS
jgi:single-strand DNA-binding protein